MKSVIRCKSTISVISALGAALALGAQHAAAATPILVWHDEFNGPVGSGPDPTKWVYDLGVGSPAGWGNSELESYTNLRANSVIVADPQATDGRSLAIIAQDNNGAYTSARIKTEGVYSFTYGRLEARVKLPTGQGLWPAFWALGSDITTVSWPQCGEMDVMEWGEISAPVSQTNQTTHWSSNGTAADYGGTYNLPSNYNDDYHVYAVDWYPTYLIYSVDGNVVSTAKIAIGSIPAFGDPFFILLNMAVGGDFPGSPSSSTQFPQSYLVDYVRVYSLPTTPPASQVWPPSPPSNLTAYSPGASQVSVSWQAPFSTFGAAVTGYTLTRASDAALTQNVTSWNVGLSTSFTDASAQPGATYFYSISATSANGASDPSAAVQAAALAPVRNASLGNISSRAFVQSGGNVAIAGFVVAGSAPDTVLIRASGPALALSPFNVAGTLPDPLLQLYSGSTVIASNQGWGGLTAIASAATGAGAYTWTWTGASSTDSALLETLNPGPYTAIVSGASGDTGVSLVEVYSVQSTGGSLLANISSRQYVGTGGNVAIAGFVIGGTTPMSVLIRASGPALALSPFNVAGTLPDPLLQLYSGSTVIASNQGWGGSAQIASVASAAGAFTWSNPTSADSALLATLAPGAYTAIVSGASGDTGVSLVEVYAVP